MTEPAFDRPDGVLFFPVTPSDEGAGGVFAACGTGEYRPLGLDEIRAAARALGAAPEHVCNAPGWRTSVRPGSTGGDRLVDKDSAT